MAIQGQDAAGMKIELLLNSANRSWIIEKIGENLAAALRSHGVRASVVSEASNQADLVHHMSWAFANQRTDAPSTMFITHLDDDFKLAQVRASLNDNVRVGICMSSDTRQQLIDYGCDPATLYFISPAHDGGIAPRKTVIGITSRVYADGRKRESLLVELCNRMDLSDFEFRIFGNGWATIAEDLKAAGATVELHHESDDFRSDYAKIMAAIPNFDFYLYLGLDEGSLGTLDALSAGVATIVTPQGFHLDLPGGITHPVISADDLQRTFESIRATRRVRIESVRNLTWELYAERHIQLWKAVIANAELPPLPLGVTSGKELSHSLAAVRNAEMRANSLKPRRMLSALSHWGPFVPLRRTIERIRSPRTPP